MLVSRGVLHVLSPPTPRDCQSLCFLSLSPHPHPRKVLLLGLRYSGLRAELKAHHAQSQELGNAVGHRQLLLRELQAKQQRILQWRQLVVRCRACGRGREEVRGLEIKTRASRA